MFLFLFLTNLACSLIMVGVIWFVQIVHYPSFNKVSVDDFQQFHSFHVLRTGFVVIPFMLGELVTSTLLSFGSFPLAYLHQVGLILVILIWLSTFLIQLKTHKKLNQKIYAPDLVFLMKSNWIRTVLWSIKAVLSLYMLNLMLK